jgi:hypothetical protein
MMRSGVGLLHYFAFGAYDDGDGGGNLEVQPGQNSLGNPLGTIIMGQGPNGNRMRQDVVDFLVRQDVQGVVDNLDLTWMRLGHTDEVVSFPTEANGRARVASPEAAWALLRIAQTSAGDQTILRQMPRGNKTVDNILNDYPNTDVYSSNFAANGYSDRLLAVRSQLGLTSPFTQEPTSGGGAPAGVLRRAGYLEVYDTLCTYGDEIEWKLQFTGAINYSISYRKAGATNWNADGSGSRGQDSLSNSRAVYILKEWWDTGLATAEDQTVTFRTQRSPNMIEMPVLFWHTLNGTRAFEYTNNVVNSLVDGYAFFVADVDGPTVGGSDLFDSYVDEAAKLAGIVGGATKCEERVYHVSVRQIHTCQVEYA